VSRSRFEPVTSRIEEKGITAWHISLGVVLDSLDGGSARRKAATYTQNNTKIKRTQTSMPRVGFEPTNPVFERAKTVDTLVRATTVIDAADNIEKYVGRQGV
jgi:hypothetical protein